MQIRLWGTRGSVPVASPLMARYGGETTCIEVQDDAGTRLILDAGTGIHTLGRKMAGEEPGRCAICFSHAHWDHIWGLPFFKPLYDPRWKLHLFGAPQENGAFAQCMKTLFASNHFPIRWDELPSHSIEEFTPGEQFQVGSLTVKTCPTNHPGSGVAYRIEADGWSFVFTGDHEFGEDGDPGTERLLQFMAGTDVALVDAHYFLNEYQRHKGWGHSAMEQWPLPLAACGVKHIIFTHFAPEHTDTELEKACDTLWQTCHNLPITLQLGRQEMSVTATGGDMGKEADAGAIHAELFDFFHRISLYSDTHIVLDSILSQARVMTSADAGTIYLVEDGRLEFSYTANDTLFPGSEANKHIYLKSSLPLDTSSIAGFVACTGRSLNIPDVRALEGNTPYSFNEAFDAATGYRTVSMLTVPFVDAHDHVLGVLQLINRMDCGKVRPFTSTMAEVVGRLVTLAINALERSRMANELILRMLRTSALRDPRETASHVRRVGAMAAEIFHRWAERRGVNFEDIRRLKGRLRLAAMLHDVGKVGIPDAILKKNGKLTPEERKVMETHAAMGAELFADASQDMDKLAYTIALHHHQKWNGQGYTGSEKYPPLSGTEIPLEARITAIADVYDALVSRRCYKESWDTEKALDTLRNDAGSHFDPELVDIAVEIRDVINAIHRRYPDSDA